MKAYSEAFLMSGATHVTSKLRIAVPSDDSIEVFRIGFFGVEPVAAWHFFEG